MQNGKTWVSDCKLFYNAIHVCINIIRCFNLPYYNKYRICYNSFTTICASCKIARPPNNASSWLSLISTLITCVLWLRFCPRFAKSAIYLLISTLLLPFFWLVTFYNRVKAAFFTGNNYVEHFSGFVPSLRCWFCFSVTVQHVQKPILCIKIRILSLQFLIYLFIRCTKWINIWFIDWRSRQTNHGTCTIWINVEALFPLIKFS